MSDLQKKYAEWQKWVGKPDSQERDDAQQELFYAAYQERLRVGDKGELGIPELESHSAKDFRQALNIKEAGGKPKSNIKKKLGGKGKKADAKAKTLTMKKLKKAGPPISETDPVIPPQETNRRFD